MRGNYYSATISSAQIRRIQAIRHAAGIDDELYAEMKQSVGVQSTTELNQRQFNELVNRIYRIGRRGNGRRQDATDRKRGETYKPVHSSARKSGMHVAPPEERAAMLSKIEAILTELKLPWSYADGIARRMFKVDLVRWCDEVQTYRVLQSLIMYQRRIAGRLK